MYNNYMHFIQWITTKILREYINLNWCIFINLEFDIGKETKYNLR